MTDDVLLEYNWDGRAGKMSLGEMKLFKTILRGTTFFIGFLKFHLIILVVFRFICKRQPIQWRLHGTNEKGD